MWMSLTLCLSLTVVALEFIDGPTTRENVAAWLATNIEARNAARNASQYSDVNYRNPASLWTQSSWIQTQMMVHDRYLYDPHEGVYTVDLALADLKERYGGIDSVLLWVPYPNIGVDDRNQFDMGDDMPGGRDGFRKLLETFRSMGVRVLLPFNPWDNGTRLYNAPDALIEYLVSVGADGFNGDTMQGGLAPFWESMQRLNATDLVMEPELDSMNELDITLMSWGYWNWGLYVPPVDNLKWLEIKHITHLCQRWEVDRTRQIQLALFNGAGYNTWENVWGIWNGITPRHAQEINIVATILRFFGGLLTNDNMTWTPYTMDCGDHVGVFCSQFAYSPPPPPTPTPSPAVHVELYTIVNRQANDTNTTVTGECSGVTAFYDCYHGVELTNWVCDKNSNTTTITFPIEGNGYGCLLRISTDDTSFLPQDLPTLLAEPTKGKTPTDFSGFLTAIHTLTARPLSSYHSEFQFAPQEIGEFSYRYGYIDLAGKPARKVHGQDVPSSDLKFKNKIIIPALSSYNFTVTGIEIEPSYIWPEAYLSIPGKFVDVQYPWEPRPIKWHTTVLDMRPFEIDQYPVTNARYLEFLNTSGYIPSNTTNFLRHWTWTGDLNNELPGYLPVDANKPVRWVDLTDARAFCQHYGGRIPHEWEWQYASQAGGREGMDQAKSGWSYPWGPTFNASCVPQRSRANLFPTLHDVDAFPCGASPLGVMSMIGGVWEWTDEYRDEHTRFAITKGGSDYLPFPSQDWYYPNTQKVDEHGKLLLLWQGLDRSGGIGFRCAYGEIPTTAPSPAPTPSQVTTNSPTPSAPTAGPPSPTDRPFASTTGWIIATFVIVAVSIAAACYCNTRYKAYQMKSRERAPLLMGNNRQQQ